MPTKIHDAKAYESMSGVQNRENSKRREDRWILLESKYHLLTSNNLQRLIRQGERDVATLELRRELARSKF